MTFSNTSQSRSPFANPLNARSVESTKGAFNAKCKDLPPPKPYDPTAIPQLHTPQAQTPPMTLASIQQMMNDYSRQKTWNDAELRQLNPNKPDAKSQAYWKKANEESKKLVNNMTDEQKKMLADVEAGKLFPMADLEEVDDF